MANEFIARRGIISLGNVTVTGSITATGGITISGSITSASYAVNTSYLNNSGSGEFVPTGSFNTFSSSILTYTGSANSRFSSIESTTGSLNTASGSAITRLSSLESKTGSYATTGSNTFVGNQTITGSILGSGSLSINGCIVSTGQIVAQTINVQQVTSSIVYSCGSNIFGSAIGNTQVLTGSVSITGSLNTIGNACVTSICSPAHVGGTFSGTTIYGSTAICGAVICGGATTLTGALTGTSATFSSDVSIINATAAIMTLQGAAGNSKNLYFKSTGNADNSIRIYQNGGTNDFIIATGDGTVAPTNRLTISSTGAATFSSSVSATSLSLNGTDTYPSAVAFITSNVNGLPATTGTSQPNAALRLRGGDNAIIDFGLNSTNTWIQATDRSSLGTYYNLLLNPRGGNVGIGTTNPLQALAVSGNVFVGNLANTLNFSGGGNDRFLEIGAGSGGDAMLMTHSSGYGVGYFGYESAGDRLIIGTDCGGGANKIDFILNAGTCTGGSSDNLNGVNPVMRITAAGNIGIGTTSTSTEANLFLGNQGSGAANEGGQLVLQKAYSCSCATHLDNYQDTFRIMAGTNTGSTTVNMSINHINGAATFNGTLYASDRTFYLSYQTAAIRAAFQASSQTFAIDMKSYFNDFNFTSNYTSLVITGMIGNSSIIINIFLNASAGGSYSVVSTTGSTTITGVAFSGTGSNPIITLTASAVVYWKIIMSASAT